MSTSTRSRTRAVTVVFSALMVSALLLGCTAEGEPGGGSTAGTGGQATVDPTDVPPIETEPPTIPTNAPGRQDSVLDSLPGEASAGCVDVRDLRDVRSGSMAAGSFADARASFAESPESTLPFYFIPADLVGDPELTIQLEQIGGTVSKEIKSSAIETADEWRFYPVALSIPEAGKWRITASAGEANKGCWEVDFTG